MYSVHTIHIQFGCFFSGSFFFFARCCCCCCGRGCHFIITIFVLLAICFVHKTTHSFGCACAIYRHSIHISHVYYDQRATVPCRIIGSLHSHTLCERSDDKRLYASCTPTPPRAFQKVVAAWNIHRILQQNMNIEIEPCDIRENEAKL